MPPIVALILTLLGCAFLLWRDSRQATQSSAGLWLPVIWIFFIASRFPTQWLQLFGLSAGGEGSLEDGNPIDALFFVLLILAGVAVLIRRRVSPTQFIRNNVWLTLFLAYCLVAILWSDFPFVAFKRWIKILGHPVMALIVLSEPDPVDAVRRVLRRSGYILIPCSFVCIRYFPSVGRYFDEYFGKPTNRGIQLNKNELGYVCLVFGLFFFWSLLSLRQIQERRARREEQGLCLAFLGMIAWLLALASSATSLSSTAVGLAAMTLGGTRTISRRLWSWTAAALVVGAGAQLTFDVYSSVIDLLGRDPTLTDRTVVWRQVLSIDINPVIGAGFESFWLGSRLETMWAKWWWHPIQAHNGYIETYLNLGWLGVFILAGLLLATFEKCRRELLQDINWGRFCLAVFAAILLYNCTEASFRGVSLLWTTFYLIAIDLPARRVSPAMARPLRSAPVPAPRPPLRAAMAGRRGSVPGDSVRAVSSTRR